jgi:hypothetical protein
MEEIAGTGRVSSSYQPSPVDDMGTLDHLAKIASALSEPTLLWVVLKKKEALLRRTARENPVAAEACRQVLEGDVEATNNLRRRAALEDKAKAQHKAIDKLLQTRSRVKINPPTFIREDVARVPLNHIVAIRDASATHALARGNGVEGARTGGA